MTHQFCTYFDRNYLSRGLALLESLRRHSSAFRLHVLCLDAETHAFLAALDAPDVVPIALGTLESADPELAETRRSRSQVEYYFTCTAAFCRFLLSRSDFDRLTYLDADLYFFSDPQIVFDEIGDASISIIPHRFSARNYLKRMYGLFNVGWVTWRRDDAGLRCLDELRRRCIAWCHDYLDGTRFADQRYLDAWPSDYPGVHVIRNKGANLAPWNLDSTVPAFDRGQIHVDGSPLVFFHFHRLRLHAGGDTERNLGDYLDPDAAAPGPAVIDAIYRPYEDTLYRIESTLPATKLITPPRPSGAAAKHPLAGGPDWMFRPQGWSRDDESAPGWGARSAIETMADRFELMRRRRGSTVALGGDARMQGELMAVAYAAARAADPDRKLSVLDWGGGVGLHAEALSLLLPEVALDYHCRELAPVAARGRELTPWVTHHDSDETAFAQRYDLVLASASLHYAESWREVLRRLAGATGKLLAVTRLPVVCAVPSYVALQNLHRTDYRTACQFWAVNRTEMMAITSAAGLTLEREFATTDRVHVPGAPEPFEVQGFLFVRSGA